MKTLPARRFTPSREAFWQEMFNDLSRQPDDHAVSGWSAQGLRLRFATYARLLPALKLPEGGRVLDLGCGAGVYSRYLGGKGYRVVGVDFAWRVAARAQERTDSGCTAYLSGDAGCLPFAAESFDHVLCIGLFQSLQRPQVALAEIFRVLKPGGSCCLMTLNRDNLRTRLTALLGREEVIVVDGRRQARLCTYRPAKFRTWSRQVGFEGVQVRPVQIYPPNLDSLAVLIERWNRLPMFPYFSALSFVVTSRKPLPKGAG